MLRIPVEDDGIVVVRHLLEERMSEERLERIEEKVDILVSGQIDLGMRMGRVEGRLDGIDGRLDGIDGRLDGIDGRLDGIDGRLDGIDGRLDRMDDRFDRMDGRLDGIDDRFDRMDGRFDRMDGRFDKAEEGLDNVQHRLGTVEGVLARVEDGQEDLRGKIMQIAEGHAAHTRQIALGFEALHMALERHQRPLEDAVREHTAILKRHGLS